MTFLEKTNLTNEAQIKHVCLEKMRPVIQSDLVKQSMRQNFFLLRTTFGANACRNGYVWRSLDAYDYVCITPHRFVI